MSAHPASMDTKYFSRVTRRFDLNPCRVLGPTLTTRSQYGCAWSVEKFEEQIRSIEMFHPCRVREGWITSTIFHSKICSVPGIRMRGNDSRSHSWIGLLEYLLMPSLGAYHCDMCLHDTDCHWMKDYYSSIIIACSLVNCVGALQLNRSVINCENPNRFHQCLLYQQNQPMKIILHPRFEYTSPIDHASAEI